jgi:retron-type reverse transcriptase
MVKAVEAHAEVPWVVLYVKRWLTAPMALPDGTLVARDRGTPQGSAVSPVLANLFMHSRSMRGWPGNTRVCASSVMPTMWSCIV